MNDEILEKLQVLCYVRPWSEPFFRSVCGRVFGPRSVTFASDFRGHGDVQWAQDFARRYAQPTTTEWPGHLDAATREDIVARCRLLRTLAPAEAHRVLGAMAAAVEGLFDEVRPNCVISTAIDSYVLDLLFHAARARRVPFFGISPVIVSGYFLVTARGEYNGFREPDDVECESVLSALVDRQIRSVYTAPYATSEGAILKRWLRELVKSVYHPIRRLKEPLNYHYWTSAVIGRDRAGVGRLRPGRFFDRHWETRLHGADRPLSYLPLQCVPEFNGDYWPAHRDLLDYESVVLDVVSSIGDRSLVLVKEHSYMLGFRSPDFYRSLRAMPNVVLIPPRITSTELFGLCHVVLTWTGSTGIEGVLHGRPVITFGEPYYAVGRNFYNVGSRAELGELGTTIERLAGAARPTHNEKIALVRRVLASCLPGDGDAILDGTPRRAANADMLVRSLRLHIGSWYAWALEHQVVAV